MNDGQRLVNDQDRPREQPGLLTADDGQRPGRQPVDVRQRPA